ncbi:hypothetical protein C8J57DRAFT_1254234 [Mycena rebaudengoi]|nr:hypothetical protein C8J57DRAFT_1254234 [Mycena rebaudengoi]
MEDVGAHHGVSVQEDTYTQHKQYYYLCFHYYKQSETLKEDINSSQDMLQDTQQELHLLQADLSIVLTDKEQSALKLEEVYQQNEEDKKDFMKLKAEITEHKHTIVDSDYKDLHSRYLQMDESIHALEEQLEANQTEFENRNAKLDNLQLTHNILQINYQTTSQHLQSSENTSKAQVEELKLQRTLLDDHHLNHKALQTEHQITLQTLKLLENKIILWEIEKLKMAQTISTFQAQTQTPEAKAKTLREKLTDTRQSLKKAEIQWTKKGELQ